MRFINADNFKLFLQRLKEAGAESLSFDDLFKFIEEEKTAYDINKVVEELEALRNIDICKNVKCSERPYPDCSECSQNLVVDKAIEIVKQSGVLKGPISSEQKK